MMNEIDAARYAAFFDELGHIEKNGMLSKLAVNPMAIGNLARTGFLMLKHPGQAAKTLQKIWARGVAKVPKGGLSRIGSGVEELWSTPGGRAAILGGGALGVGGAGYLAGRSRGGQNVYVR